MININTASKKQLMNLTGIGVTKADKILSFRESGGSINNIEELSKITNTRKADLEILLKEIEFKAQPAETGGISSGTITEPKGKSIIPVDPYIPIKPLPLPLIDTYQFKVKFASLTSIVLPDLSGYQLLIEYRIGNLQSISPKIKTINLRSEPSLTVSISKPFIPGTYLENTFRLILYTPDKEVLYDSTFEIDKDDEVTIRIPTYTQQGIKVSFDKTYRTRIDGFVLKVKYRINRAETGVIECNKTYDLGIEDPVIIKFDPFGKVKDIKFELISDSGIKIYDESCIWSELNSSENEKTKTIQIPKQNEIIINASLQADVEASLNPYLNHRLEISFDVLEKETLSILKKVEESYLINDLGKSTVNLTHYGYVNRVDLKVYAPGGEVIGTETIVSDEWNNTKTVEIKVPARSLVGIEGFEMMPERPTKTAGRVIDIKGDKQFEGVQVIIYGSKVVNPEEKDFVPLAVFNTETKGYFIFDTPKEYFEQAYAEIGIPKFGNKEGYSYRSPISLESDTVVRTVNNERTIETKYFFPGRMIVVVDTTSAELKEGESNECCDLNFHRNKEVVDEFSFYSAVRTTEPKIQGYTLEENGEMTIQKILEIVPISDEQGNEASISPEMRNRSISRNTLMKYVNNKKGLTLTTLKKALAESDALKLQDSIKPAYLNKALGRHKLDFDNSIDWDEDPTIYQATTIAHGHLLHFKQEWKNNGYGMGDLLYSLPLAPGQQKQIVVLDWERRESAGRAESLEYQESLYSTLSRDRDVNEIVTGVIQETAYGGSNANSSTNSTSGGLGGGIFGGLGALGGFVGYSGGSSNSNSSAWQNSTRNTSLRDLQQIRDRTIQSANAVRGQRSTVITQATQGERFSAETSVVANYNHCHSLTIQYFEVLRHMQSEVRLSSVQECLFIPLIISPFDHKKILRWREPMERFISTRQLRRGFDAIERIENDYEGSNLPEGMYADDDIEYWSGELIIKFDIPCPVEIEIVNDLEELRKKINRYSIWGSFVYNSLERIINEVRENRRRIFYENVAPQIAAAIVDKLQFQIAKKSGSFSSLNLDTTLLSRFQNGLNHYVSVREKTRQIPIKRAEIEAIVIRINADTYLNSGQTIADFLPPNTKIIVTSGSMNYRSKHYSDTLFNSSYINNDLVGYNGVEDNDSVRIPTPLNSFEMRNPRNEDLESANKLKDHLNDNLEYYHKLIWMNMSSDRRFMFLDGIQVTDYSEVENYPLGVVRSVASVVENKVAGIVGNSLVMPVAAGFRLDPNTRGRSVDLISLYQPITPLEPINITLPTKGVFAEAVLGKCNSCEKIENDRFWKWEEHPIPNSPTSISEISTASRQNTSPGTNLTPSSITNPMITIQNSPTLPDSTGLTTISNLLKEVNIKDLTGLDQNQKNAIEALKISLTNSLTAGTKAAELVSQLDAIKNAKENKLVDENKSKELAEKAIVNNLQKSEQNSNDNEKE